MSDIAVPSQIIPMQGMGLLLPDALLAEIMPFAGMEAKTRGPDWLLGEVLWRGQKLPLMSFESANGEGMVLPRPGSRFAVLHCITGRSVREFFAILIHGLPTGLTVEEGMLQPVEGPDALAVKGYVMLGDEIVRIPDPDVLEPLLNKLD